ncbi:unnamed protein product [Didymodactylos carnosus]|uniref:Uncharacterized protein n=1 Tax=Didymodactylos carnosus TaxID=1234261 RepID=A0A815R0S0_9BILA|nr:unnamed protein product [Didymodactylos carnosus]CAF4338671.1 unnamed protein product [Didymodactylos carnosus]CAF4454690.1 unnamed protein product [Didymodactylos carnosus]
MAECLIYKPIKLVDTYKTKDDAQNFIVLWLYSSDSSTNNEEEEIYIKLKKIFNYVKKFDRAVDCISYILEKKRMQFILIVSHTSAKYFIPIIHEQLSIIDIYIYCKNQKEQQQWIEKSYLKTQNKIFIDQTLLFQELENFVLKQNSRTDLISNETSPLISYFNETEIINYSIKNLDKQSIEFIKFQLIIEVLLRMPTTRRAKQTMIDACRDYYKDNAAEQKNIKI